MRGVECRRHHSGTAALHRSPTTPGGISDQGVSMSRARAPHPPVPPVPRARPPRGRRLPLVAALALGLVPGSVVFPAVAAGAHGAGGPSTSVEPFGTAPDGTPVERWTLANG